MALPDDSRARRLPTLSWDSIVDGDDTEAAPSPPAPAATPAPPAPSEPPHLDPAPTGSEMPAVEPLTLGSLPGTDPVASSPASYDPAPPVSAPPVPAPPAPAPPASAEALAESVAAPPAPPATSPVAQPVGEAPAIEELPTVSEVQPFGEAPAIGEVQPVSEEPPVSEAPPTLRTAPPSPVVVPAAGSADAPTADALPADAPTADAVPDDAPTADAVPDDIDPISAELPEIREATPVETIAPVAPPEPEYRLPSIPQPDQRHVAPTPAASTYVMEAPAQPSRKRAKRSRRGVKLFVALLVLGGLVAAGIVYGRPYLFPQDWDPAAEPYAQTVEDVRGVEYPESLVVTAEPTPDYTTRMTDQLTGDWTSQLPEWRALGILTGDANQTNVRTLLEGWSDAVHDQGDGQVYHDDAATGRQLDAQVTQAFASALLDQQYGWVAQQPARTLDDAAFTLAEVQRQAAVTQADSAFPAEVKPRATAPLSFLPPVLAYRVLAPATFAQFDRTDLADDAENPLRGLGAAGPGPLAPDTPVSSSPATPVDGDTITGSPTAMDRSFWYLVFAGYLDTRTAYAASEAIVENSMTLAERVANRCVYATFSGGDVDQTATLRAALEAWSSSVPLEMSSSFSVQGDGTLQLVTCDPGSRFDNGSRVGVGRELIGWRMAEIATTLEVNANGGNGDDVAAAWAVVEATNVPVDLANLPFDTTPAAAAEIARTAVAAVLPPAGG